MVQKFLHFIGRKDAFIRGGTYYLLSPPFKMPYRSYAVSFLSGSARRVKNDKPLRGQRYGLSSQAYKCWAFLRPSICAKFFTLILAVCHVG